MENRLFAEVIINNKCKETDRIYHYAIPEELEAAVCPGSRVIVPFGIGNKQVEGYVMGVTDTIDINISRIKKLSRLIDDTPVISRELVSLAAWMRDKYLCYYVEALQAIIPTPVRTKSSYIIELNEEISEEELEQKLRSVSSTQLSDIIEYLEFNNGRVSLEDLRGYFSEIKIDYYLKKLLDMEIIHKKQILKDRMRKKMERLLFISGLAAPELPARAVRQREIIDIVERNPGIALSILNEMCPNCGAAVRQLEARGYIRIEEREAYRNVNAKGYSEQRHMLTDEQQNALESMRGCFAQNKNVVLHGVTGSGKTEVYMEIIEEYLQQGKDSIMLVPEISLTPQMIGRFKGRFGDNVAVLHSSLSEGEKFDEWRKIKAGLVKVAIGARSAVFAPFSNLGIIIIDEEHEHTYKSEVKPKYITREVAERRCLLEDAHLILGSATPSIETYYRAKNGDMGLVELPNRVNGRQMPQVSIIDMREELKGGNKTIFSNELTEGIENTLKNGDQLILFLNRRGHSTFVSCRECGLVMKCPSCSISMTYHMKDNKLCCHYCGYERANPEVCPKCKSKSIRYFGVGTQKVEKEFHKKFGITNTLRMDADTTTRKNSHEQILDKFRNKQSSVLLGTQMISKGLDFPDVTLVGVITADTSLNMPDFRAPERTFQMIAQVAGRAGRGQKSGKVIVQTYTPEHYSILCASKHDYKSFYDQEIALRQELRYPPFAAIGNIIISGTNEHGVIRHANETGIFLDDIIKAHPGVEKLGPASAPLSKIKNKYRWQIVLKSVSEKELKLILSELLQSDLTDSNDINVSIDLNPVNML